MSIQRIRQAVKDCDVNNIKKLIEEALSEGVTPLDIIEEGLAKELREVGEKFGRGEIFLMDLMGATRVMEEAMEVLRPALEKRDEKPQFLGKVLIGTVEGDIHDIGKNIVSSMLQASGFEVIDLGKDVPIEQFIDKVREVKPEIVGASALLTITLPQQEKLVRALERAGLRNKVKVIIGGAPVTREWTEKIGADGYGADAMDAVKLAKRLLGKN